MIVIRDSSGKPVQRPWLVSRGYTVAPVAAVLLVLLANIFPCIAQAEKGRSLMLEERQRVEYEETRFGIRLSVSATGQIVSVFIRDKEAWQFFEYCEEEDKWRSACIWEVDFGEFGSPWMRWGLAADGSDVLRENRPPHRMFRLVDGAIQNRGEGVETERPRFEPCTGRLVFGSSPTISELVSFASFEWANAFLGRQGEDQKAQIKTSPLLRTDTIVLDVSSDHGALLDLGDVLARGGPVRSVEADGKPVEYWPANGRPRAFDQGAHGQYSPDSRFVMVNFRYDDDGTMFWYYGKDGREAGRPGVVQIFDREGDFQTEVFVHEYRDNCSVDYAQACWLRDNWIVYTSPYDLVFVKVRYECRS
jgi:hypothetical protein